MPKIKATTIDEYIHNAPSEAQKNLYELYFILRKAAPQSTEGIKWGSPVFEETRILFAFAAFKTHLNLMPTASSMKPFKDELAKYKTGKSSIQFPHDKPLPKGLILKIARFRVKELREKDVKWMAGSEK